MSSSILKRLPALLTVGLVLAGSALISQDDQPIQLISDAAAETPSASAPDFSLRDINGKKVSLSDYKGSVVLLNFWATWCGPCQTEMPHLEAMYKELGSRKFVVLAISADDARNASKVKPLIKRNGFTFPVLLDKENSVVGVYNPESTLPYNVLINEKGEVIWRKASYAPGEEVELKAKVVEALAAAGY